MDRLSRWEEALVSDTGAAPGVVCELCTDPGRIAALAPEWEQLLERSRCNRAFSSPAWFLSACESYPALSPRVFAAWRGCVLTGILPLVVRAGSREAMFASDLSDYNDAIVARDDLASVSSLLTYARTGENGFERLLLRRIRRDSNLALATSALDSGLDLEACFDPRSVCLTVRLGDGLGEYLATRSDNFRGDLRRAMNRAARSGAVIRELEPGSFPPGELPAAFLRLQLDRFGEQSCFLRAAEHDTFLRIVLPRLFTQRWLRAFALFEAGEMVAIDLCMVGPESLCSWNGGFLARAARLSPIKLLLRAEIERALALGFGELDLLRGNEAYKTRWSNGSHTLGSFSFAVGASTSPP
jgi:CelD/BcsL family acetyltransferase involved in cellulose biosynthesis